MTIFDVLSLIGGLALFLYGMSVMGSALEKLAGGRFRRVLEKITSHPMSGILLGTVITAIIQSSSATTVMVVGFVNSGLMTLENSVGVIMGANIGTAATAWILSLTGIESSNVVLNLFKPSSFTPILAAVGVAFMMFSKSDRKKDTAQIMLGFAVLMFGMDTMSAAVKPLADVPEFTNILTVFSNPLFGVLAGTFVTAIIQSSSASVGILQAMTMTGSITYATAIPIVLGQNIGTCVTALISSTGANANAKRAALIHLYFNLLGVVVCLILFYTANAIFDFTFMTMTVKPIDVAVIHTIFKIVNTIIFLPLRNQLVRLATISVRDDADEEKFQQLDERFLATPSFAVTQCRELTVSMAKLSYEAISDSMKLIEESKFSQELADKIIKAEDGVDKYEDKLGTFMVKLSSRSMSASDSRDVAKLLHCIGDFERISDHAVNIMRTAEELHQKNLRFSTEARRDLMVLNSAIHDILEMAVEAFERDDMELAFRVEPLEQVINQLTDQLKMRHVARLQRGDCTTLLGFVFSDLITNYERVADHCSNVAVAIIQVSQDSFHTHEYLNTLKRSGDEGFSRFFDEYKDKYSLVSK